MTSTQFDDTLGVHRDGTASYADLDVLAQRVTVSATGDPGAVSIDAGIDCDIWSLNGTHLPTIDPDRIARAITASGTTVESGTEIVVAAVVSFDGSSPPVAAIDRPGMDRIEDPAWGGEPIVVETIAAVAASTVDAGPHDHAVATVGRATDSGYDRSSGHRWSTGLASGTTTTCRSADTCSTTPRSGSARTTTASVPRRTPTGCRWVLAVCRQAYQGSAFWDQEIYNLPAFLFTESEIARSLLVYRHRTLDGARRKPRRLGYDGASAPRRLGASATTARTTRGSRARPATNRVRTCSSPMS